MLSESCAKLLRYLGIGIMLIFANKCQGAHFHADVLFFEFIKWKNLHERVFSYEFKLRFI